MFNYITNYIVFYIHNNVNNIFHLATETTHRYTLQPIFNAQKDNYRCHIALQKPRLFYKIWFYLTIAKINFETERFMREVEVSFLVSQDYLKDCLLRNSVSFVV